MTGREKPRGSKEAQAALRAAAVRMLRSETYTHQQIADALGVARGTVSGWSGKLKSQGTSAVARVRKRGRPKGDGVALTPYEKRRVRRTITTKTPDQLSFPFYLWSIGAILRFIETKLGKSIAESTLRNYLKEWGFSVQRPKTRATAKDDVVIERWVSEVYPEIKRRAEAEGAEIHWLDETGVDNQTIYQRGYAPKGKTPVVKKAVGKDRISVISTVTNKGKMRFMTYAKNLKGPLFIEFLERLIKEVSGNKGAPKKLFIIMDNLKVHKSQAVRDWVARPENKDRIELFYLPPYAPEHNPDEYLNNDLKQNVHTAHLPKDKRSLKANVSAALSRIQKSPRRVRSYFRAEKTLYAA